MAPTTYVVVAKGAESQPKSSIAGEDEDLSSDDDFPDSQDNFDDEVDALIYRIEPFPTSEDDSIPALQVNTMDPSETAAEMSSTDPCTKTTQTNHQEAQHTPSTPTTLAAPGLPLARFTYDGITCFCTAGDHERDPSLPPASPRHIDKTCRILEKLQLSFHKYHRYLICGCYGGSFIALDHLKDHMKSKHTRQLRRGDAKTARADYPGIVQHIATSFQIYQNQSAITFSKETLAGPIVGIAPPAQYFACPRCGSYCNTIRSLASHTRTQCKESAGGSLFDMAAVTTHWTQYPFATMGWRSKRVQVDGPLAESRFSDPAMCGEAVPVTIEPYVVPEGIGATVPPWLKALGWVTWRDRFLAKGLSFSHLCGLAAEPKLRAGPQLLQLEPCRRLLYNAKTRICKRFTIMLEDANLWLCQCNSELRSQFTTG